MTAVSELDEHFEITQYQPDKSGRATVELANGTLRIRVPYHFHSAGGVISSKTMVMGEATAQQLSDVKAILIAVLQATNDAIEQHGWSKYIDPGE